LADLAKEFHLEVAQTRPVTASDPLLELGNTPKLRTRFSDCRPEKVSQPARTDRGYVVLTLKQVLPAHQGNLEEVHDKVVAFLKQEKLCNLRAPKRRTEQTC